MKRNTSRKTLVLCANNFLAFAKKTEKQCIEDQISRGIPDNGAKVLCKPESKAYFKKVCSRGGLLFSAKEVRDRYKKEVKSGYIRRASKNFGTMLIQLDMLEAFPKIYKIVRL